MNQKRLAPTVALLACATASLLAACGPPPKPPAVPEMYFPPPPAVPRYKLQAILHGEADYARPASWFRRVFLGAKRPEEFITLIQPFAMACHPTRSLVYVSDWRMHRIVEFDVEKRTIRTLGDVPGSQVTIPVGLALDANGNLYVADSGSRRVVAMSPSGVVQRIYGAGQITRPSGVAVDSARRRVYVSDAKKNVIVGFDLESGKELFRWGRQGTGPLEFSFPGFLTVDREGNLLVADALNFRYQIISPDGKFISQRGKLGDGPGHFFRLKGLAVDAAGRIYAVDSHFNNFQVFRPDGQLLLWVGGLGPAPGGFVAPAGVCVSNDHVVWVADQFNHRIQGFKILADLKPTPAAAPASAPASSPAASSK